MTQHSSYERISVHPHSCSRARALDVFLGSSASLPWTASAHHYCHEFSRRRGLCPKCLCSLHSCFVYLYIGTLGCGALHLGSRFVMRETPPPSSASLNIFVFVFAKTRNKNNARRKKSQQLQILSIFENVYLNVIHTNRNLRK